MFTYNMTGDAEGTCRYGKNAVVEAHDRHLVEHEDYLVDDFNRQQIHWQLSTIALTVCSIKPLAGSKPSLNRQCLPRSSITIYHSYVRLATGFKKKGHKRTNLDTRSP